MENIQLLKDSLTVVIPSKNEGMNLYHTISSIASQYMGYGLRVIVADCSDEDKSLEVNRQIQIDFKYSLNIEFIPGGYPAYGRYKGGELVTTPYVLFMDADIILFDRKVIYNTLQNTTHLSTVTFTTDYGFNWIYDVFTFSQRIMKFFGSSFAIGGYQLFRTDIYNQIGGYDPTHVFAEDYYVSNKVFSNFFTIHKTKGVYTSARRFKNKGLFYMVYIMLKCWVNKDNPNFYKKSHGYWD
jgi:glycosyltransferase involved in cell wall biosynthesis